MYIGYLLFFAKNVTGQKYFFDLYNKLFNTKLIFNIGTGFFSSVRHKVQTCNCKGPVDEPFRRYFLWVVDISFNNNFPEVKPSFTSIVRDLFPYDWKPVKYFQTLIKTSTKEKTFCRSVQGVVYFRIGPEICTLFSTYIKNACSQENVWVNQMDWDGEWFCVFFSHIVERKNLRFICSSFLK